MKRHFIDISRELTTNLVVFPGDPKFSIIRVSDLDRGHRYNLSRISMGTHTGTHVDAPLHVFAEGRSVDQIPWPCFIGKARVFDLRGHWRIDADRLRPLRIRSGDIVLLKTADSSPADGREPAATPPALTLEGAKFLVQRAIRTVGIDQLSVEPEENTDLETHCLLLQAGIAILEGLVLSGVASGKYILHAAPLKLRGGDGAPLRAVLESTHRRRQAE